MKKILYVARIMPCAFLLLLLASCGCCRHTSNILSHTRDSLRHASRQADSLARITGLHDSIYVHDSIHIIQRGDTVTRYVERTRTRYVWHTDTVRILRQLSDTVYVERTDTVRVEQRQDGRSGLSRHWGPPIAVILWVLAWGLIKRRC